MEAAGAGHQRIRAHVPQAEIARYATDLRSMTGGQGTFSTSFVGYEECPSHVAQRVIAAHGAAEEEPAAAAR
jgi:elongation factor G